MKTLRLVFAVLFITVSAPYAFTQAGEVPLRNGDKVTISIGAILDGEAAQVRGVYSISDEGTINLLHIGEVHAAGLRPSALQRVIEKAYKDQEIYTRPNVLVSIDSGETTRQVFVTGVQKPGAVPYHQDMTLSQAIQAAGGPTAFASMKKVKLLRPGKTPSVHNLSKDMGNPAVDVILEPNDQINVPEK